MSTVKYVLIHQDQVYDQRKDIIKLIFNYADVDFEDRCLHKPGELLSMPPYTHFPWLQIGDGECLSDIRPIARYLARRYDLVGSGDEEAYICDVHVDAFSDLFDSMTLWYSCDDPNVKKSHQVKATTIALQYMKFLESHIVVNNDYVGYLVGAKLTWADLVVGPGLHYLAEFCALNDDNFADFPKVKRYFSKIITEPRIKKWIADHSPN